MRKKLLVVERRESTLIVGQTSLIPFRIKIFKPIDFDAIKTWFVIFFPYSSANSCNHMITRRIEAEEFKGVCVGKM